MFNKSIDKIGNFNAQLFRELKGRVNGKNIALAGISSLVIQFFISLIYQSNLPYQYLPEFHRYCMGTFTGEIDPEYYPEYYKQFNFCVKDALGNLTINWQLWNLDIFIGLSIFAIFVLLITGSYVLINDLTKEEEKGTLNFIRMSPESAKNFFLGKIVGVPILIYLFILVGFPYHLVTGLKAGIPLIFILSFDTILAVSCVFFYSLSLLYSLAFRELSSLKTWLGSGVILFGIYLLCIATFNIESLMGNALDWSVMFYPGTVLTYLVKTTNLGEQTINYLPYKMWNNVSWFGLHLWKNSLTGMGFILVNYLLGIYGLGLGLSRLFYNPNSLVFSKKQSYFITTIITLVMMGFTFQTTSPSFFFLNICFFLSLSCLLCLTWILILSPSRQIIQEWSRYHHYVSKKQRYLLTQLIFNDESPSIVAIMINWLIISLGSLPLVFFLTNNSEKIALLGGLISLLTLLILLTTITQLLLLLKSQKRNILAFSGLIIMVVLPLFLGLILEINLDEKSLLWLFSIVPTPALIHFNSAQFFTTIISQWLAIAFLNIQMTRKVTKLGVSSSKLLLG